MPEKKPVTGRLSADTHREFQKYMERHDITQSEAVRRMVNETLEADREKRGVSKQESITELGLDGVIKHKVSTALSQIFQLVFPAIFLLYLAAFAWVNYQTHGLWYTLGVFALLGIVVSALDVLVDWVKAHSEEEEPSFWSGLNVLILGSDDAAPDGGVRTETG